MSKMRVSFEVTGFVCVDVDAEELNKAIETANAIVSDADFGPLHDIDWEFHSCEKLEE